MEAIAEAIRARGPITFAEYMELVLYGHGGFYEYPPIGPDGAFVTSPHVHPVFGELLAEGIRGLWEGIGRPTPLRIAEVGAGDGSLAVQLIRALGIPIAYAGVERSARARERLDAIPGVEALEELASPVDVVLCNELLDNLPFRLLRGGSEVRIGLEGERLVETLVPAEPELSPSTAAGEDRVVPIGAFKFVDAVAGCLEHGYALIIDYGALGTTGGPIHGYRRHAVVEDLLADPGTTDVTSGVDFELIASHAEDAGLVAFPSVGQREALLALGLGGWLDERLRRQRTQQDARDGRGAVRTFSDRNEATMLVDPGGLGRLRWLVLATPGLPPPGWLVEASRG